MRVTLLVSDGIEYSIWDAVVGFIPMNRQYGLAGLAGFLNSFDAAFLGEACEFTLDPNVSFPGQHMVNPRGSDNG